MEKVEGKSEDEDDDKDEVRVRMRCEVEGRRWRTTMAITIREKG